MKCECKCIDTNNNIQMRQILRKAIFLSFFFYKASTSYEILYFHKKAWGTTETATCCLFCYFKTGLQKPFFFYIFLFYIFFKELYTYCYKKMNIEGKSTAFRKKEMIFWSLWDLQWITFSFTFFFFKDKNWRIKLSLK